MRGFNLDQLKTFVAVVDAGSLAAAAPVLHLSQSSVSEQVRKLEARAGVQLFSRSKRGVELTSAGARLMHHARRIVALNEAAFDDLHGQAISGELRLAITDYFRTNEVAGMLLRLRECYPELSLRVSAMKSADIELGLAKGQIDLGVVMTMAADKGKAGIDAPWTLRREPLSWVASPSLAAKLAEPVPIVLLPDDCAMHQVAVQALEASGVRYVLVHHASGVAGLQSMVAAGLGISCLCASAIGDGIVRLDARHRLPPLPGAVFSLTPPQPGEREKVAQAREVLARQLQI